MDIKQIPRSRGYLSGRWSSEQKKNMQYVYSSAIDCAGGKGLLIE